jgi:hypothetical protein
MLRRVPPGRFSPSDAQPAFKAVGDHYWHKE